MRGSTWSSFRRSACMLGFLSFLALGCGGGSTASSTPLAPTGQVLPYAVPRAPGASEVKLTTMIQDADGGLLIYDDASPRILRTTDGLHFDSTPAGALPQLHFANIYSLGPGRAWVVPCASLADTPVTYVQVTYLVQWTSAGSGVSIQPVTHSQAFPMNVPPWIIHRAYTPVLYQLGGDGRIYIFDVPGAQILIVSQDGQVLSIPFVVPAWNSLRLAASSTGTVWFSYTDGMYASVAGWVDSAGSIHAFPSNEVVFLLTPLPGGDMVATDGWKLIRVDPAGNYSFTQVHQTTSVLYPYTWMHWMPDGRLYTDILHIADWDPNAPPGSFQYLQLGLDGSEKVLFDATNPQGQTWTTFIGTSPKGELWYFSMMESPFRWEFQKVSLGGTVVELPRSEQLSGFYDTARGYVAQDDDTVWVLTLKSLFLYKPR